MTKKQLVDLLKRLVDEGRFSHAYIIEGDKNGCKTEVAVGFAQSISKDDIIMIRGEGHSLGIEELGNALSPLGIRPVFGERNVAIIEDADMMSDKAQNRLLKTLEDPPGHSVIILLSENVENLLPTVLSRCVIYHLDEEKDLQSINTGYYAELAAEIGSMIMGKKPFYAINKALAEMPKGRDAAREFLDALELWFRDILLKSIEDVGTNEGMEKISPSKRQTIYQAVVLIEDIRRDLNRFGNAGYGLKSLALKLTK